MSKEKYPSIFLKSNGGYCVYYPSNIFRNTRDLPVCHMSITSKFINWLPKSPFNIQISLESKAYVWGKSTTFERKRNFLIP